MENRLSLFSTFPRHYFAHFASIRFIFSKLILNLFLFFFLAMICFMRIREWELVQGQSALPFWLRLGRFWPLGKQFLPWERNWAKPSGGSTWTRDLDSWLHCTRPFNAPVVDKPCPERDQRPNPTSLQEDQRERGIGHWSVFQKLSLELIDHQAGSKSLKKIRVVLCVR